MSALAAAWVCWAIVGFSPVVGKWAVGVISPALLVFLGTLSGVLYFAPWVTQHRQWKQLFAPNLLGKFLFIGTFGTALPFTISLVALHYTTPGNAAILQQSELFYSLLIAFFFLREIPTKSQLAGSALIVAGVWIILAHGYDTAHWTGDLLIVGSTWMLQAGSAVAKRLPKHLDYRLIGMARNLFAVPALLIILMVLYLRQEPFTFVFSPRLLGIWGYTGILKYGLAMVVWYKAIRALDLSKVTAIYLSYPVLSLLISAAVGMEVPSWQQIIGLVMTGGGAYWISLTVQKEGH